MVLELFQGSLEQEIRKYPQGMSMDDVREIALQYFKFLDFLYKHGVVHADLKPENTLIRSNRQIVICDFGSTYRLGTPTDDVIVTANYRAPEIFGQEKPYGTAVDMWSVGAIIAKLISGRTFFPYQGSDNKQWLVHERVLEKFYPPRWREALVQKTPPTSFYERTFYVRTFRSIITEKQLTATIWEEILNDMLAIEPAYRPIPEKLLTTLIENK
jgi:serine/threonine protein kinase